MLYKHIFTISYSINNTNFNLHTHCCLKSLDIHGYNVSHKILHNIQSPTMQNDPCADILIVFDGTT